MQETLSRTVLHESVKNEAEDIFIVLWAMSLIDLTTGAKGTLCFYCVHAGERGAAFSLPLPVADSGMIPHPQSPSRGMCYCLRLAGRGLFSLLYFELPEVKSPLYHIPGYSREHGYGTNGSLLSD